MPLKAPRPGGLGKYVDLERLTDSELTDLRAAAMDDARDVVRVTGAESRLKEMLQTVARAQWKHWLRHG